MKLIQELQFKAIRSGGAGGQHVNKVSSKVVLNFDVGTSEALTEQEKKRICLKLESRLTSDHILLLHSDESRSQHKNKELVTERFLLMVENALKVSKKRIKTKPSGSAIEKRLKSKLIKSKIKAARQKAKPDH
ncbi:MAG: alternative ribosome rescue aminoacyl-tRNA hydrolase ArfB [Flavobacteriaceae bacterium]|nr:alternative ribosome rescue aminoacyl-tRNA hydrolase ArfB [Flavobacteriaceae bacterium]